MVRSTTFEMVVGAASGVIPRVSLLKLNAQDSEMHVRFWRASPRFHKVRIASHRCLATLLSPIPSPLLEFGLESRRWKYSS
jgi:hypothetical protein